MTWKKVFFYDYNYEDVEDHDELVEDCATLREKIDEDDLEESFIYDYNYEDDLTASSEQEDELVEEFEDDLNNSKYEETIAEHLDTINSKEIFAVKESETVINQILAKYKNVIYSK